jgi:hypothetical protein
VNDPVSTTAVKDAMLDSSVATLALTAVAQDAPEREIEVLKAIQEARYAGGKDVTSPDVVDAFPHARVIAASDTIAAINGNVANKIETWSPQLGDNGPKSVDDMVIPTAFDGPSLTVDGRTIEIVAAEDMINRRYLWVPDLQAVIGGVLIFSGTHVWTADTQTKDLRAAWVAILDALIAHAPDVVVPGHMSVDAPVGVDAITFTKSYIEAFEEELDRAATLEELIAAMVARYPELGTGVTREIGAKVALGEMDWG